MGGKGKAAYATIILFDFFFIAHSYAETSLWHGDHKKDPINDSAYSVAFLRNEDGRLAIRCKDHVVDVFISSTRGKFVYPLARPVTVRFNDEAPADFPAIVSSTENLVTDFERKPEIFKKMMTANRIAVRFKEDDGLTTTLVFGEFLKPNQIYNVGRVLADCAVMPFPDKDLAEAIQGLGTLAPQEPTKAKKDRR